MLRQISWAAASAILLAVSRFVFAMLLARRVPEEIFGQYAYAQWAVDFSFMICSLGVNGAISRYVSEYDHDRPMLVTIVRRWQWLAIGLPFFAILVVVLGVRVSGTNISSFGLVLLAFWALFAGLWAMQTAALIGMRRFDLIFRANAIAAGIMLIGVLLLPSIDDAGFVFGMMAVACGLATSVGFLETIRLGRGEAVDVSRDQWVRMGRFAVNSWIATLLASLVWSRGEFPVVQTMLGDRAIAQYAAAYAIIGAAIQGISLGMNGVAPHLTNLWGRELKQDAIRIARTVMDLQLVLTATGTLFLLFFGSSLISLAFTETYLEAGDLLLILCLGLPGFVVSSQSFLLQLETDARFNRNVIFYGLFALYALAFALVPFYGLFGAAIARAAAMSSVGLVVVLYAVRYWGREVASLQNFLVVIGVLSLSAWLSHAADPEAIGLRLVAMAAAMALSIFAIRDVDGQIAVRSLYRQLYVRIFPSGDPVGSGGSRGG